MQQTTGRHKDKAPNPRESYQ